MRSVSVESGPSGYVQTATIGPHRITADEPAEAGGTDEGPNPPELLLAAYELTLLGDIDVCYLLRIQQERIGEALIPSLREYTSTFGLTVDRAARLSPDALVMHPGPMNRGVEIAPEVADSANSVITEQVANGVAVRMAVLFRLLGSGTQLEALGPAAEVGE